MTRAEAKTNLIALGITEPTNEQIGSYLDSFQGDLQKEKDKADLLKGKADQFDQSQIDLEAERSKNLTAEEKLQAAVDAANLEKVGFARATNKLAVEKILLGAGLTETDYADLIDGLVSDSAETSTKLATGLATMIANQKVVTESRLKEQQLKENPVPPGSGGKAAGVKTDDVVFAEQLASSMKGNGTDSKSVFENY